MKIRRALFFLPVLWVFTSCATRSTPHPEADASPSTLPPDAVAEVERLASSGGYDLDDDGVVGPVSVAGWEGFPTKLTTYHKTDSGDVRKNGRVITLNPTPNQTARWIVQAVIDATGSYDRVKAERLLTTTRHASGFQFIVRGVHWEDMTNDGIANHIAYPFRDGVTVQLRGLPGGYPSRVLTDRELQYVLDAPESDVTLTAKYARIQSTTREEYRAIGTRPVEGHLWRGVVRDLYQAAWGKDRNELMTAKARAMFPHR